MRLRVFALIVLCVTSTALLALFSFVPDLLESHATAVAQIENVEKGGDTLLPTVYSGATSVSPSRLKNSDVLIALLQSRNYEETSEEAVLEEPGTYARQGDGVLIHRRAFPVDGVKAELIEISSRMFSKAGNSFELYLEPVQLGTITDGISVKRDHVELEQIPELFKKTVLILEDKRFYKHQGFDPAGITRALIQNWKVGEITQGASTITQQLVKILTDDRERSYVRKVRELLAAVRLESRLSKDEILELYLNNIFLAQDGNIALHGVETASRYLFAHGVKDLDIAETALLAGMIRAPSRYNPYLTPENAIERRDFVLRILKEEDLISYADYQGALKIDLPAKPNSHDETPAPHFMVAIKKALGNKEKLPAAVKTGIEPYLQQCAEEAISDHFAGLKGSDIEHLEAGLLVIDHKTDEIKAWSGSRDFWKNQFDHVAQLRRPIGSAVKPFLYLSAFEPNLNSYRVATPVSLLKDQPLKFMSDLGKIWSPENYGRKFRGEVDVRDAFIHSLNIPAVYMASRIGFKRFATNLKLFGFNHSEPAYPSLALGSLNTSLFTAVQSYTVLARGGIFRPVALGSADEIPIYFPGQLPENLLSYERRVASEASVFVLTDLMRAVISEGTGYEVRKTGFESDAAGKTGTSDDKRDLWFIGFTPSLTAGVWVGRDDNKPTKYTGGTMAAPIWARFMKCAAHLYGTPEFETPENVSVALVNRDTGYRVEPGCSYGKVTKEYFVSGTEPPLSPDCEYSTRARLDPDVIFTEPGPEPPLRPKHSEIITVGRTDDGVIHKKLVEREELSDGWALITEENFKVYTADEPYNLE